jgi:hypothetical protein
MVLFRGLDICYPHKDQRKPLGHRDPKPYIWELGFQIISIWAMTTIAITFLWWPLGGIYKELEPWLKGGFKVKRLLTIENCFQTFANMLV